MSDDNTVLNQWLVNCLFFNTSTAKLPNYVEATTLPSYEEAERSKMEEALQRSNDSVNDSSLVSHF